MYGAIIGDLAGSIYEYEQLKKIKPVRIKNIIEKNSFYSDDTILTIAVLEAVLNDKIYEKYLRDYIMKFSNYKPNFTPYFDTAFSKKTIDWSKQTANGTSKGNGAMMRISPIGYLFNKEEDIINNAYLATVPSHNSKEAITSATTIALMIYYFRNGMSKNDVYKKLGIKLEYKPFTKFNTTCSETFGNCMYVLYNSNSFEDAIRKTIIMGGDTDTNGAIVGSVAEAIYGIDEKLIEDANKKLPKKFVRLLEKTK